MVKHGVLDEMCCEAFCRGLCSILSSSAILVLDIVDVAVGAALLFCPLLWSSYVTAAPATIALPSYGACLVILSAVSLFGVRCRAEIHAIDATSVRCIAHRSASGRTAGCLPPPCWPLCASSRNSPAASS